MKKFTKLFLSCAAVAAITASAATMASAEEKSLTATYQAGESTGTVTITCASEDATKTLLVLKGTDKTDIKVENILQIDQAAEITTATVPVLEDGKYTVLMGGTSGDIYAGTFQVGTSAGEDIKIGDIDLSNEIDITDGTYLTRYLADFTTRIGKAGTSYVNADTSAPFKIGDIDVNGEIDITDGTYLVRYLADFTTRIGQAGTTVSAYAADAE